LTVASAGSQCDGCKAAAQLQKTTRPGPIATDTWILV